MRIKQKRISRKAPTQEEKKEEGQSNFVIAELLHAKIVIVRRTE